MRKLFGMMVVFFAMALGGCAALPSQTGNPLVESAKAFGAPPEGKAHLYVYRDSWVSRLHGFDLSLDGKPLGVLQNKTFFLVTLDVGKHYKLETESEFGSNILDVAAESGKTYYVEHYPRIGLLLGQADFNLLSEPNDIAKAQASIKDGYMQLPNAG